MKAISLLIALLWLGLCNLMGQTPQVEWGPKFKQSPQIKTYIAGVTQQGFYTYNLTYYKLMPLKVVAKSIELQRFNHDMVQTKNGEISLKYKEGNRSPERFLLLDGQLFLFTSYQDKERLKQILLVEKIDLNTLSSKDKPMEIGAMPLPEKNHLGQFEIKISRDSSKVLVYANRPSLEGEKERFSFAVFDYRMQELWILEEELPYEDRRFGTSSVKVSNKGEVILSAIKTELNSKGILGEKTRMTEVHFFVYLKNGTERQQYIEALNNREITALQLELSPKGELLCGGLYMDVEKDGLVGTFLFRYDTKTQNLLAETYTPFDDNILAEMIYRPVDDAILIGKKAKEKDRKPTTYLLNDIILKQDGGIVLVAESYHYELVSSYINDRWVDQIYHHFGNILVVSLDPEGEVDWYKLIKKQQVSQREAIFSSYKLMVMPDRLCFIYNDNKQNKEGADFTYNFTGGKNAVVSLTTLRLDGSINKEALIESKDEGVFFIPFLSFQYNNKEMLLRAEKRRNSRYARVTF